VSVVVKRSVTVAGHRTSVSLEEPFWEALREIAGERGVGIGALVASVDEDRSRENLSSALRLLVLRHYRDKAGAASG
jgi:predicted DNA-binding ribbon-helix-helix protein